MTNTQNSHSIAELMEAVSKRLRELDHHFFTDRQYSLKIGRRAHSESKGNHYWVTRFATEAASLRNQQFADGLAYLSRLEQLIDSTPREHDYASPYRAQKMVHSLLATLKDKL
jgi:hypothetical protein